MRKPPKAITLAALVTMTGCYSYHPAPARLVEPGTDVQIHLTEAMDVELASVTVRDVVQVQGQLTDWTSGGEAMIFTTSLLARSGVTQQTQSEVVAIPEVQIEVMEAPKLDGMKTAVVVGAGVAALIGIIAVISGQGNTGGGSGGGPPPPPTLIRIPLGR